MEKRNEKKQQQQHNQEPQPKNQLPQCNNSLSASVLARFSLSLILKKYVQNEQFTASNENT